MALLSDKTTSHPTSVSAPVPAVLIHECHILPILDIITGSTTVRAGEKLSRNVGAVIQRVLCLGPSGLPMEWITQTPMPLLSPQATTVGIITASLMP